MIQIFSNSREGCRDCGASAHRIIYEPDKAKAKTPKKWSTIFWRYYHIHRDCLRDLTEPLDWKDPPAQPLPMDVAALPVKAKETPEMKAVAIDAALALLRAEWVASRVGSSGEGGASSSSSHKVS